jgi:predicted nuclease of predicted toxin-antitoxin system
VRFLVDAQLPPQLTQALRDLGHEAEHVFDLGLTTATDAQIWRHAVRRSAAILIKDADFAARRGASRNGPVVIWIRFGNTTKRALLDRLLPVMSEIAEAIVAGETLIEVR